MTLRENMGKKVFKTFEVVSSTGLVLFTGTRKSCWRFCEMYDRYANWNIRKCQ